MKTGNCEYTDVNLFKRNLTILLYEKLLKDSQGHVWTLNRTTRPIPSFFGKFRRTRRGVPIDKLNTKCFAAKTYNNEWLYIYINWQILRKLQKLKMLKYECLAIPGVIYR